MVEAGLQEVGKYISRRQNTVPQFITTRPIMDLCLTAECRLGSRVTKWWWDQDSLYLEWMCMVTWEA